MIWGSNDTYQFQINVFVYSLFAAEGGGQKVYGCEMSKTMYELSVDVIASNNMTDKITILHRKSNDIDVPKDIPERYISPNSINGQKKFA